MSNIYAIARKLQMPGLEVKASFHPTRLTKRLFNSARKMVASGRIEGNGGAAKVAQVVLDSRNVSYITCNAWGMSLHGGFEVSDAVKQEIRDINEAYLVVHSMQDDRFDEDDRKRARNCVEALLTQNRAWLSIYNAEYRTQIAEIFLKNRRPRDLHNTQQLLTAFESGEPFPISI